MKLRAVGAIALVAALGLTFGHLLEPFDFLTFLHAGRDVLHGRLPYAAPSSQVFRSGHAFVYPLYVAWLFAPLAALPVRGAEVIYAAASVTAIALSCRLLGRSGVAAPALVLTCSTTIVGLQMGTLNAFLLLGLACAWRWRDTHPVLAGVLLGATATAKLFLLPVLLWPILRRRHRQAAVAAATVVGLMLVSAALGPLAPLRYLQMMSKLDAREQVRSWSLSSLVQGLGAGRSLALGVALIIAVAGVAGLWWKRRRLADGQVLAATVLCSLLVSPILWSSYLLLVMIPLLLVSSDCGLLAMFAVCSWAIVTPDAASPTRVAIGLLAAVVAGAASTLRSPLQDLLTRALRTVWPRVAPVGIAAVVFGLAMVALPGPARSPLPAVTTIVSVAAWSLRTPRRHRNESRRPVHGPPASGGLLDVEF
ncbi:MAG: glycosyltransferase family 87 protein [Actinomycetota bacterium]|nr:glycosyltransferase family 87 protein [Actinomycetota bacterium]